MKISRDWLQAYFDAPLPDVQALGHALTFHAFEIESIENDILDVKVTPNRGHDCLSHRGIARELSAILTIPIKKPEATPPEQWVSTDEVGISIENPELCSRYIGAYIRGVKVGPSPEWLIKRLESIGQRSINNIVDVANFVMFDIGEPLHAFDAQVFARTDGRHHIAVRCARAGESIVALDDKSYTLDESMLVIADGDAGTVLGIAGVKGGKYSGVSETTTDIILEAAQFDGPSLRKTARALKFRTDATQRFEQVLTPELAGEGMRAFVSLVLQVAGGELVGVRDEYPCMPNTKTISTSIAHINAVLGTSLTQPVVDDVCARLRFEHSWQGEEVTVVVPHERLDLLIPEDLIEEVGRIVGYDTVEAVELPSPASPPEVHQQFCRTEAIRDYLVSQGFSEVFTSVFAEKGDRVVLNKVDGVRPYLRNNLKDGLAEALAKNIHTKELLGLSQVKIFEIGTVWYKDREEVVTEIAVEKVKKQKTEDEYRVELNAFVLNLPTQNDSYPNHFGTKTERYQTFSKYPYIVRDIALWVPTGTTGSDIETVLRHSSGELLVHLDQFDRFEKEGRISYAFRLVFQSFDTTLTDHDANQRMESVYSAVRTRGWEVR